ncbi:SIS domain-containing protein [Mangrovibrevibacter kandeliae]|uniref:SIS domain-containing protein n=1 Tax=Mangrovibrevibacter kandeliae TaxID=2968473 RepID=UPI002117889A|nr:SIS domain-containing protein [Aurantimonas sp. CSK15Z-1]MCQ8781453.1 SIS domain-containing protein [Aurantimonas sp. CSK15Z-1]
MTDPTFMRREIAEIPAAVRRLLSEGDADLAAAGAALRERDPAVIATVARGSSDHAASYLKYAIELTAGVPVASLGPSIASIYHAPLKLARGACIAISQSGQSPDIVALAGAARAGGATVLSLTNAPASPLGAAADRVVDIKAGPERSVAATKSFVTSVVAGLAVLARWQQDTALQAALAALPDAFEQAIACDWTPLAEALDGQESLYILGRGPAHAIAMEAALKFKETCGVHAEAYSGAEVMHGPVAIVRAGFPVIALIARDAAQASMAKSVARVAGQGANVFATASTAGATTLPFAATGHALTDPLVLIASFYGFIEMLARRRGLDPDAPPHLKKVTETV